MNLCGNLFLLKLLRILYTLINVVRFVVPIMLIIKLFIDVYHAMIMGEGKRIKELSMKRLLAAVIVFLVPTMTNLVMRLVEIGSGESVNTPYCLSNLDNIRYYEELAEKTKLVNDEKKLKQDNDNYEKALYLQAQAIYEQAKQAFIEDEAARFMGQTYNLTNTELNGICGVARSEQGSIDGAKAEASLMANLYELLNKNNDFYGKGLYNYVRNSGWFAHAAQHMEEGCSGEYLDAVRDVLINGNRTLPLYINEHDCFACSSSHACGEVSSGDICSINTSGVNYTSLSEIRNRSNYVKNDTKVYTYYYKGGYWVFYTFPAKNSDPFGYTIEAKNRVDAMSK